MKPRPLVRSRIGRGSHNDDDLLKIVKAQVVQDGIRRDEERKAREEERSFYASALRWRVSDKKG